MSHRKTKQGGKRVAPIDFHLARPVLQENAWASLINGLPVNDTKIYVHSWRKKLGPDIRGPSVVHASRAMLKAASPRFEKLLFSSPDILHDGYESDSDFEDEPSPITPHALSPRAASPDSSRSFLSSPRVVSPPESDLDSDFSTLNSPDDINYDDIEVKPAGIPEGLTNEQQFMHADSDTPSAESLGPIQDGAYKTWQAVIYYLWSGRVNFSTLKSRDICKKAYMDTHQDMFILEEETYNMESCTSPRVATPNIFTCSPKSMYRLAHMLMLEDLKRQALSHIRNDLTEYNVVHELFSDFTWRYPEVLEMESEVFGGHKRNEFVGKAMQQILAKVGTGELPHSTVVLRSVFGKLWTRF